ncbi:hypothetical protein ABQE57_18180 [Mycolicibacterium elephantis]|uniref:Intersectin-EH binding protein Ibp1 n=1 Tax=Mycolicibacterium elephantis TaxID=81858 RepID=A0A0M2ZRC4_9MYCO|nr:hypothetical protein [Mycolicibacterium elephantis]KKW66338.1 hypothetical protein AAV95_02550 [Mycolicibacterium elephantis]OBA85456.1 hypothetical protein A5633_01130 [Mycolicibacterium elephantis]ORA59136.1 hypothetical protein BST23_24800 [Mycolicibacterium elephantis]
MAMTITTAGSAGLHLRRRLLVPTAVFGAAVVLSAQAFAAAAPDDDSWDIEAYDNCMKQTVRNADLCCIDSGGVPTSDPNDTQPDGSPNCYAPPAEAQGVEQPGVPPRLPPGAVVGQLPVAPIAPAGPQNPGVAPIVTPTVVAPG